MKNKDDFFSKFKEFKALIENHTEKIHDQDLPMHLWAEATRTMVYVYNRTPHRVLENKKPEEVFFGKKPEVSHLRIFVV